MKLFALIIFCALFTLSAKPSGYYTEDNGQIFILANNFAEIDTQGWKLSNKIPGSLSKKYIESKGIFDSRKKISYQIEFKSKGKFYCYIRSWAATPADNGCYIRLNKKYPDNPGFNSIYFPKEKQWNWQSKAHVGVHHDYPAYFMITKLGTYRFQIGIREVGAKIDAIVLKKNEGVLGLPGMAGKKEKATLEPVEGDSAKIFQSGKRRVVRSLGAGIVLLLVVVLLVYIFRKERDTEGRYEKENAVVAKTKAYIHENYSNPITLDDIAKSASLSKSHLRSVFRNNTNTTVNKYLLNYRLEMAHKMLEEEKSESVAQIAFRCGFENASHFATAFKDCYGYPPSKLKS